MLASAICDKPAFHSTFMSGISQNDTLEYQLTDASFGTKEFHRIMNVQCTSKLQRFNLLLIFTLTIAITAPSVFAKKFDATIDILPLRSGGQLESSPSIPQRITNWAPLGTHDSGALPTPAPPVLIAKAKLRHQQDKTTNKVIVDQVAEPFVVVGPLTSNALKASRFHTPWQMTFKTAKPACQESNLSPLDLQLQELVQEEPIDIESHGPSVLNPENRLPSVTGIEIAAINPLVGSSAMIATIEEDYMPYDLSAGDLKSWNTYPIASHAFNAEHHTNDEQTTSLWDDFDIAMALSRSSDPAELNGIGKARLVDSPATVPSPSSPSNLSLIPEIPSNPVRYQASKPSDHANAHSFPIPTKEDSAITPDEALVILTTPGTLSLSPAPESSPNRAAPEASSNVREQTVPGAPKAGPADVALSAIIQNLSDSQAFKLPANMEEISRAAGRLIGSYTGNASQWIGRRVTGIALNWPTPNRSSLQSRVGAKLLSRASVLESGIIEENTIGRYIPVERLDGVDCGSQATMVVADANGKTKAR
ncbi:MAG: hypothetical protein CMM07_23140 [Rhodopirellula sp.]|nr:hypothetical protein [Rhodopirellula sp.]